MPYIEGENLVKIYKTDESEVFALQGLDLEVDKEEMVLLMGASGSGKTTLLNILSTMENPSGGRVLVNGIVTSSMNRRDRKDFLLNRVGFLWQDVSRNLIPYLSIRDNILMPMTLKGRIDPEWADYLLGETGLYDLKDRKPGKLSGGQQQRAALAIAYANKPDILLADEPTGSLDRESGDRLMELIGRFRNSEKTTVIAVTHDESLRSFADRALHICDGKISFETKHIINRKSTDKPDGALRRETMILDRAGRVQLPAGIREKLNLGKKVSMEWDDDKVTITSYKETAPSAQ